MTDSDPNIQMTQDENRERFKRAQLEQNARNGANYFFWIAFFSIFNQVMDKLSATRRFVFGLGAPVYVDRLLEGSNPGLIWAIIIVLAVVFVIFGIFARRQNIPIYILGIIVYLADMVFSILAVDIIGTVVHLVFIVLLVMGLIATRKLKAQAAN